ncbi:hypothetical protein AJ79_02889 [Helicocarpus griseus UAMH5409]|uniref:Protein kinase domain-containing protein n=1 Tax=Helicocarpus griseus UAMH5409 TaxID=1447875 RepID=A0A2B7Y108_9EURO|nr:hypothetical protein AJ79_02889 [Helicocarpus griseus UAMH5409]
MLHLQDDASDDQGEVVQLLRTSPIYPPDTYKKRPLRRWRRGDLPVRIRHTKVLAKVPALSPIFSADVHAIEKKVYERLGNGHPNILKYLDQSPPDCKLLQNALFFEYHPRGMLAACLDEWKDVPARVRSVLIQWPFQAVSAVAYIHSHDIVHADLGLHNFLLSDDGSIVLCDFAGSSIDGCNSQEKQFPNLDDVSMPVRGVIERCWTKDGYTASEALQALEPHFLVMPSYHKYYASLLAITVGFAALFLWGPEEGEF